MRIRMASITSVVCAALVGAVVTVGAGGVPHAQAALDDDDATPTPTPTQGANDPNASHVGVDLRLRNVWVPKSMLQLFVDTAPGGASNFGIGADVFRRKGNFEVQFGLEYEKIFIDKGIWVEKDKLPPGETVDYVRFDNFGWVTAEVTFLNHTPITKFLALRYGGGAGLGVLFGHVRRTDYSCTSADLGTCHSDPRPEQRHAVQPAAGVPGDQRDRRRPDQAGRQHRDQRRGRHPDPAVLRRVARLHVLGGAARRRATNAAAGRRRPAASSSRRRRIRRVGSSTCGWSRTAPSRPAA